MAYMYLGYLLLLPTFFSLSKAQPPVASTVFINGYSQAISSKCRCDVWVWVWLSANQLCACGCVPSNDRHRHTQIGAQCVPIAIVLYLD